MSYIVNVFGSVQGAVKAFRELGGYGHLYAGTRLLSRTGESALGMRAYVPRTLSVEQLGFTQPATYADILRKGVSLGLEPLDLESGLTVAILSGRRDRVRTRCASTPIDVQGLVVFPVFYTEYDGTMKLEGEPIDDKPWLLDRSFTFADPITR